MNVNNSVCLVGCGSIGTIIAEYLDSDSAFDLSYLLDSDASAAKKLSGKLKSGPIIIRELAEMDDVDLVIEAASQDFVRQNGKAVLGKSDIMVLSVGALADEKLLGDMKKTAEENGKSIYIPSGAIPGLDGIKAASIEGLENVLLTTRKPPESFEDSSYVKKKGIEIKSIKEPMTIFEGSAEEAALMFPRNVNVSIALSLAGIGAEKTRVRVIADPSVERNVHEIEANGDFGKMELRTENLPSPKNPRTSYLAALSAIAMLKGMTGSIQVGT